MHINIKQQLWSKYHILNDEGYCNIYTLIRFVNREIAINGGNKDKAKKTIKDMLSYLPKREIIQKYGNNRHYGLNKKRIIDDIVDNINTYRLGVMDGLY